jgi:transcriptional regulator with XRE-family HTH domain
MKADALESAAPFLFAEAEIGAEKLEVTGEFSGERLLARRPEVYRAICRMSAEGLSMSAMARALGVSRNTVAAVQEREGISIEQHKKELLRNVRTAARLSVERVVELVPTINNAKDAAIVAAVMVDKLQLLSGEATSRIEKVEVNQDKLSEMLASLPVLEAEVLPVTGPSGNGSAQKGPDGSGAGTVSGCLGEPVSDTESEVSAYAGGLRVATLDATCAAEPVDVEAVAVDQEGGEGVGFSDAPPMTPTGLGEQKIFGKGVSSSQEAAEELSTN